MKITKEVVETLTLTLTLDQLKQLIKAAEDSSAARYETYSDLVDAARDAGVALED